MRRAERARLFLDLVEDAIKQGQPVEETLISVSQSRDLSMGARFHLLAAWLEQNLRARRRAGESARDFCRRKSPPC